MMKEKEKKLSLRDERAPVSGQKFLGWNGNQE